MLKKEKGRDETRSCGGAHEGQDKTWGYHLKTAVCGAPFFVSMVYVM